MLWKVFKWGEYQLKCVVSCDHTARILIHFTKNTIEWPCPIWHCNFLNHSPVPSPPPSHHLSHCKIILILPGWVERFPSSLLLKAFMYISFFSKFFRLTKKNQTYKVSSKSQPKVRTVLKINSFLYDNNHYGWGV